MKTGSDCPLVLSGFMGAGKSCVGRLVAARLGYAYLDTDDYVREIAGESIRDMLTRGRLDLVRTFEARAVGELTGRRKSVIATGAGVMANEENAGAFARCAFIVYIRRDFNVLYPLISRDPVRVMAYRKNREELKRLYDAREPVYAKYADLTVANDASPEACAEKIARAYLEA